MNTNLTDIESYRDFSRRVNVPLFARDYWLDAVCPGQWNVFLVSRNGKVVAAMPYHEVRKLGMKFMLQPCLTQVLGPQIDFTGIADDDYARRLFFRECVEDIMKQIDRQGFAYQQIAMHRSYPDCLPFYWNKYRCSVRYTYVTDDISDASRATSLFSKSRRRDIKSAKAHGITVDDNFRIEDFYDFHKNCVSQKGESLFYTRRQLMDIHKSLSERGECLILVARDSMMQPLSAGFFVTDNDCAYLLMTANLRKAGNDGAFGCLIEKAICSLSGKVSHFDFEGSMIKGAEQSYSKYGTSQKTYLFLEKYSSIFMEFLLRFSGKTR